MQNKKSTGKKKFNITPDKIAAFEDKSIKYKPVLDPYVPNIVSYGMWEFEIKKTPNNERYTKFKGIYRNGYIELLNFHGYFKRLRPDGTHFLLHCNNNIIEEVEVINISDFVLEYMSTLKNDLQFNYDGLKFEASLQLLNETIKKQCHSIFNKAFLHLLPNFENEILRDTPKECYKLFKNGVCKINADGFTMFDYKDLNDKCVWKKHLIDFDFNFIEDFTPCHYYKFIRNVSDANNDKDRYLAFTTAIGYLSHNYNAPEKGQAVICYDEVITDVTKPQGGTGKGVFARALGFLSNVVKIDGKKFDENQRFCFQRVQESTQIVFFDDVKSKLGFARFHSILTDGWDIEKKNKDEFQIAPEDSPKIIITSNLVLSREGTTNIRRQHPIEFSNHYSQHIINGSEEPIKDVHQCIFFGPDWDNHEWQMFYSFMINCISEYMSIGLHHYKPKNIINNRLRQITNDDFAEWVFTQEFDMEKPNEIKPFFWSFKSTYYPDEDFSQRKFTGYLKKYATLLNLEFEQPPASNGISFFTLKKK